MGYSCTAIAGLVQDALISILQANGVHSKGTSNGWTAKGKEYFFERGREQEDGAITGSIYGPSEKVGCCHKVGSYKISADGKIERWPTSTAGQREEAQYEGNREYERKYTGCPYVEPLKPADSPSL